MDTASLRQRFTRLVHTHSSVFGGAILDSGLTCSRCGWCCCENFKIKITEDISRPSNAISVFPDDIRRIMKGKGIEWDEIVQPDIYSCLNDDKDIRAIGWILRRNALGECIFYRSGDCTIYDCRPMICRCYPFFMENKGIGIEVMHCERQKDMIVKEIDKESEKENARQMALLVKRYEMKKLRNYISIISQLGEKLRYSDLYSLPHAYDGELIVCDGDTISRRSIKNNIMG